MSRAVSQAQFVHWTATSIQLADATWFLEQKADAKLEL